MKHKAPTVPLSARPDAAGAQTLSAVLGQAEWIGEAKSLANGLGSASPTAVAESLGRAVVLLEALWHRTISDAMSASIELRPALLRTALLIRSEMRSSLEALEAHRRRHMLTAQVIEG